MPITWRRARLHEACGGEIACTIQPGDPVCEIRLGTAAPGDRPLIRCAIHALEPVPAYLPPLEPLDQAVPESSSC